MSGEFFFKKFVFDNLLRDSSRLENENITADKNVIEFYNL